MSTEATCKNDKCKNEYYPKSIPEMHTCPKCGCDNVYCISDEDFSDRALDEPDEDVSWYDLETGEPAEDE